MSATPANIEMPVFAEICQQGFLFPKFYLFYPFHIIPAFRKNDVSQKRMSGERRERL